MSGDNVPRFRYNDTHHVLYGRFHYQAENVRIMNNIRDYLHDFLANFSSLVSAILHKVLCWHELYINIF